MEEETITIITNLDRICRTCLTEKNENDLRYIFENEVDNMLLRLADIKVSLNNVQLEHEYILFITG